MSIAAPGIVISISNHLSIKSQDNHHNHKGKCTSLSCRPDCGNSEFFINLQANTHLDKAYGGYCVFAVAEGAESEATMDRIAAAVKAKGSVRIDTIKLV